MNKLILIGNLTSDPELKGTESGHKVCTFGLAVNDRRGGEQQTQFFRVSAWDRTGEACMTYLKKGKKAFVSGPLTCRTYSKHDGSTGVSLEVTANDVEFLSPREESPSHGMPGTSGMPYPSGMTEVDPPDLPF
ncbi:MAG: single-stranded DNA-binding protein [Aristaeellaceae bacterium]